MIARRHSLMERVLEVVAELTAHGAWAWLRGVGL